MKKLTISKIMFVIVLFLPILATMGQILIAGLNENSGITLTSTYVLNTMVDNYNMLGITKFNPTWNVLQTMYTNLSITDTTSILVFAYMINVSFIYAIINIPFTMIKLVIYKCDKLLEKMEK